MPTSIDPPPGTNEIECGRCGAYIYIESTRCPQCGVNLYEPGDDLDDFSPMLVGNRQEGVFSKIGQTFKRLFGRSYSAEEVFGDALDQALMYNDLLRKVGGDKDVVERLVAFEEKLRPEGNRNTWLGNAIHRWERDNRVSHTRDNDIGG